MLYDDWRDAVARIKTLTGPATEEQYELAAFARLEIPRSLPSIIAGARLQSALRSALAFGLERPATDLQREIVGSLKTARDRHCREPLTYREADAWVTFFRLRQRQRALERLRLHSGDVVTKAEDDLGALFEISSINDVGRVFLRGVGRGAWPDLLTVSARISDASDGAQQLRRSAVNQAVSRAKTGHWSLAKQAELKDFAITQPLTREDVNTLIDTIECAADEKPIQAVVQQSPQLLTSLLAGNWHYLIPHPRLGSERVPDFVIGEVDSLGVHWMLVELETPRSNVTLQHENQLDRHARKGLSQIVEWREWLQNNLSYARNRRQADGLGLMDIRPNSEGLVIVGRRGRLRDNSAQVRNPIRERIDVRIHTYDWWIERLEGVLGFRGPWAVNPYILRPDDDDLR